MSDFGYSDDPFQDYSWFCNSIDNSTDSNSSLRSWSPGNPNHKINKVGAMITAVIWAIVIIVMIVDLLFNNVASNLICKILSYFI